MSKWKIIIVLSSKITLHVMFRRAYFYYLPGTFPVLDTLQSVISEISQFCISLIKYTVDTSF